MPTFRNGDVEIAYLDEGEGDPIVLVHGFASNKEVNWVMPGWTATLRRDGRRVIALDNRGHGQSAKLYDPALYHTDIMAGDVAALIEHLKLPRADVMGYSLGSRISVVLAARRPELVRGLIVGGAGIRLIDSAGLRDEIAESLEMPSLADVTDPMGKRFRAFAEQTRSDLTGACRMPARLAPGGAHGRYHQHPRARIGRGRHEGRHRRLAARACRTDAERARARHPGSRSHGRGRRQGVQGRSDQVPAESSMKFLRP